MKSLQERDGAVIWHPYTPQKNILPPIPVVKGKGTLLYAEDGSTYIDAISSWWVTIHGHAHPYIAKKIYEQAKKLEQVIFAGFTHEPAINLAERLLNILPGSMSRIFYSDNGSTATEVAIKMALQYWWNQDIRHKNKILAFSNSYHGDTFGAMSMSHRSIFTLAFQDKLFEVIFIDTPTEENIGEIKKIVEANAQNVSAFIYEPLLQGAGGMLMYDAALMNELLSVMQSHNIICIADEVLTGFGRTGKLFASSYLRAQPDIICLSKGLTGGTMALGVTACNKNIYDAFVTDDKLKTFFHGHSFTANPLACTAALASMDLLLSEECLQKIEWLTAINRQFCVQLNGLKGIKNVRQSGTILAFEIESTGSGYLNNISRQVTSFCLEQGVYLRPLGNTIYTMPPYCITPQQVEKVFESILKFLQTLN